LRGVKPRMTPTSRERWNLEGVSIAVLKASAVSGPTLAQLTDEQVQAYFASTGRIAIIWSVEDVKEVRPDLDDEQCAEVLSACENRHDANIGINWEVIETRAGWVFPAPS
jgi:hypothetical protein